MWRTSAFSPFLLLLACVVSSASSGDADNVKRQLDKGANPNQKSISGYTALGAAIRTGNLETVKVLLNGGADPNLPTRGRGYKGKTAPIVAVLHSMWSRGRNIGPEDARYLEIFEELLNHGADVDGLDTDGAPASHVAIQCMDKTHSDSDGHAQCYRAAHRLIESGASLTAKFDDRTLLDQVLLSGAEMYFETYHLAKKIVAKGGTADLDRALIETVNSRAVFERVGVKNLTGFLVFTYAPMRARYLVSLGASPENACSDSYMGHRICPTLRAILSPPSGGTNDVFSKFLTCAITKLGESACEGFLKGSLGSTFSSFTCGTLSQALQQDVITLDDVGNRAIVTLTQQALEGSDNPGLRAIGTVSELADFGSCMLD